MRNNRILLKGCLGTEPEAKETQEGNPIMSFTLVTSDTTIDDAGEVDENPQCHDIRVLCPALVSLWEDTLEKGDRVLVEGQLEYILTLDGEGNALKTSHIVVTSKGDLSRFESYESIHSAGNAKNQEDGSYFI